MASERNEVATKPTYDLDEERRRRRLDDPEVAARARQALDEMKSEDHEDRAGISRKELPDFLREQRR